MIMPRVISVSAAPYDGYAVPEAFDSLASCGVDAVEPAFIVGYTEPFDETAFTPAAAARYRDWLGQSGLACRAMSSHIDLGLPDAMDVFRGRMDFARAIGARVIATNAAVRSLADGFFRNIEPLLRHAETLGLVIGLENPGDGRDNLFNTAADGLALMARIDSPHLRLNYDPANTASHAPDGPDPARDAIMALPGCAHMHIKDVRRSSEGWFFESLGHGDIDCAALLQAIAAVPALPISIELPLRLHRRPDAQPVRRATPVGRATIEAAVRDSLAFVRHHLVPQPDGSSEP